MEQIDEKLDKLSTNTNSTQISKKDLEKMQLNLRQEVFDHLVFPLTIKLDENVIIQLFRKLHIMSSIDYKITLEHWIDQSLNFLPGITEKEATVLFNCYKILASEFEIPTQNKTKDVKNGVDVRYFGLFIALQCFSQKNKLYTVDTLDKFAYNSNNLNNYNSNPNIISSQYNSPLTSPRGKQNSLRNSNTNQINDINNMINFVKYNIKLFLRLVATDIHNSETTINSGEFNTLKFFFRINDSKVLNTNNNINTLNSNQSMSSSVKSFNNFNIQKSGLSSIAPFFLNFSPTTKVNIEKITDWISNMISNTQMEQDEFTVIIKNLSKCTTVKSNLIGKCVKIINCEDSQIFIDSCVTNLKIASCTNCVLFVVGVAKITTFEKSENCTLTICSNYLRIGNTIECKVNSYVFKEPVLYGNNIGLVLGPHNVIYDDFSLTLKSGRFNFEPDKEYQLKYSGNNFKSISQDKLFSTPIVITQPLNTSTSGTIKTNFEIISIKEFSYLATPFNVTKEISQQHFLAPKEYLDEYIEKRALFNKIQQIIKDAELDSQQEKALHVAVQGHFKEWLINSGNVKNITDIIKVIDISSLNKSDIIN